MKLLDLTLPEPAANLAVDEALLDLCEEEGDDEVLRFWEPTQHFVVVGYSNQVRTEVAESVCRAKGIPILRRCSGGGTVLQGPGCLNYAVILRIGETGPLTSVTETNRYIMTRQQEAIEHALHNATPAPLSRTAFQPVPPPPSGTGILPVSPAARPPAPSAPSPEPRLPVPVSAVQVAGHTDLTLNGLKFSGNSQRRRRHCLLFHGTFLLNFDIALVSETLRLPSRQPVYRQNRAHAEFLVNLNLPAAAIKEALQHSWQATTPLETVPADQIARLVREKYRTPEWNHKF